jgi:UDP-N-acetyl-D-glucosamine dehydrogenase
MHLLMKRGAKVTFSDPFIEAIEVDGRKLCAQDEAEGRSQADCVVIITDHSEFDYGALVTEARLIVDTRNSLKRYNADKIVRL